jgi:glucoamylase
LSPARIHWSADDWQTVQDTQTSETGLGIHLADLPTAELKAGTRLRFTFYWPEANHWEGTDFAMAVVAADH